MSRSRIDVSAPLSQAIRLRLSELLRTRGRTELTAIVGLGRVSQVVDDLIAGRNATPEECFAVERALAEYDGRTAPSAPADVSQPGATDKPIKPAPAPSAEASAGPPRTRSPGELRTKGLGVHECSLNEADRSAEFVCSTDCVDAFGEVVEQSFDLSRYHQNPVVLFAHNSRELPIGSGAARMGKTKDGRPALVATVRFASEKANPLAEQVFQCVREKVLRTVSIGFIPRTIREETRDGRQVTVLADNELHEISVCPVPANPEALMRAAPTSAPRASAVAPSEPPELSDLALQRAIEEAIGRPPAEHLVPLDEMRSAPERPTARDVGELALSGDAILAALTPHADDEFDLRLLGLDESGPQPITRETAPHAVGDDLVAIINGGI